LIERVSEQGCHRAKMSSERVGIARLPRSLNDATHEIGDFRFIGIGCCAGPAEFLSQYSILRISHDEKSPIRVPAAADGMCGRKKQDARSGLRLL
jgi:hypothetical protein